MTIRKRGSSGSLVENADGTDGGTGTIKLGPLVEFLAERTDALLSTEATAIATCKAQSEAAGILAEIDATAPKESGGGTTTTEDSLVDIERVAEFVEHAVQRQMRSATAPEDQPVFAPIPTGERTDTAQAALLETFELRPGASDVPSYHEFNTLQIAFEHVWTQIFDGEIESIGRELYKEYVGLKDFLGYDAPDTTITTVDDLRRLMGEIKELSQSAQTDLPSDLGGNPTPDEKPKSAGDLENAKKTGAIVGGIVTGGLIALVAWAVDEISRAGQKPVLHWADVNGGALAARRPDNRERPAGRRAPWARRVHAADRRPIAQKAACVPDVRGASSEVRQRRRGREYSWRRGNRRHPRRDAVLRGFGDLPGGINPHRGVRVRFAGDRNDRPRALCARRAR